MRHARPDCQHILVVPGETTESSGDEVSRVSRSPRRSFPRTSRYRALLKLHLVEEVPERKSRTSSNPAIPINSRGRPSPRSRLGYSGRRIYHSHSRKLTSGRWPNISASSLSRIAEDTSRRYVRTLYNSLEPHSFPAPLSQLSFVTGASERVESIDPRGRRRRFHPNGAPSALLRRELRIPEGRRLLNYMSGGWHRKRTFALFLMPLGSFIEKPQKISPSDRWRRRVARPALVRLREEGPVCVTWLQYCSTRSPPELASVYRTSDLFVHPGIQETFGLVTLERQACGTPVVGIRGSYMDRIVFSNPAALGGPENTPCSAGGRHRSKIQRRPARKRLAKPASPRERHYSWKVVVPAALFAL